ncbi:MAG TPA: hypothetical protein VLJ39_02605, partial [Tepidisphaeraceae bacterium]|nr:hypothetical protein [Tepidisphaeraceae bacterium]
DQSGNIWGLVGGTSDDKIFELPAGSHSVKIVQDLINDPPYSFIQGPPLLDAHGNLFATSGHTVFELPAGASTVQTVAQLPSGGTGDMIGGLIMDGSGDLFGATQGIFDLTDNIPGEIFEVPAGSPTVRVLGMTDRTTDTTTPLVLDPSAGLLYGLSIGETLTNGQGQTTGIDYPEIFDLPISGGALQVVAATDATTGLPSAVGSLFRDSAGNFLGITDGVTGVFELPAGSTTITNITDSNEAPPVGWFAGGLHADSQGNIFGFLGGSQTGPYQSVYGVIYQLVPESSLGGGGGNSTLTATIARTTLPASIVSGGRSHGAVTIDLTNNNSTTQSGPLTVAVYASQDGQIDGSSVLLGSASASPVIRAGKTAPVLVNIKSVPASLNGTYTLLAQASDKSGNVLADTSTGPTLAAAAPFLAFSETIIGSTLALSDVSGQKTTATVRVRVTNNGNVAATKPSTLAFYVSPDTTAADGALVRTTSQLLPLRPGASATITLPLHALPSVANRPYFLVFQAIDPDGNLTSTSSSTQYQLATPFVSLVPTLDSVSSKGLVKYSVINNGNVTPAGRSTVTLLASATANPSDATQVASNPILLPVAPGKSRTLSLQLTKSQLALATGAQAFFLQIIDPNGNVQTSPPVS